MISIFESEYMNIAGKFDYLRLFDNIFKYLIERDTKIILRIYNIIPINLYSLLSIGCNKLVDDTIINSSINY